MKVYRSKKAKQRILSTYQELLNEWKVPVKEVDVPTEYGITHVNVCGNQENAPLVLFHGVGDDSALMWIYNMRELSSLFCVYAIDTIGGPGKSIPNENYNKSFDDALWIDAVLDYLELQNVNLLGVSHGGYLVQYYALVRSRRVNKGLCLAASIPVKSKKGGMKRNMMKIFLPEALFPTTKNVVKLIKKMSGSNSAAFTNHELIMLHFRAVMTGFNNMAMRFHKTREFTDEEINVIRDKCFYLVGLKDPFMQLGGGEVLKKYGMNAMYFEDVGHGINHEIAEKVNQIALEYFTKDKIVLE